MTFDLTTISNPSPSEARSTNVTALCGTYRWLEFGVNNSLICQQFGSNDLFALYFMFSLQHTTLMFYFFQKNEWPKLKRYIGVKKINGGFSAGFMGSHSLLFSQFMVWAFPFTSDSPLLWTNLALVRFCSLDSSKQGSHDSLDFFSGLLCECCALVQHFNPGRCTLKPPPSSRNPLSTEGFDLEPVGFGPKNSKSLAVSQM